MPYSYSTPNAALSTRQTHRVHSSTTRMERFASQAKQSHGVRHTLLIPTPSTQVAQSHGVRHTLLIPTPNTEVAPPHGCFAPTHRLRTIFGVIEHTFSSEKSLEVRDTVLTPTPPLLTTGRATQWMLLARSSTTRSLRSSRPRKWRARSQLVESDAKLLYY